MKKILLTFLTLGGLLFASSCQMDEPDAGKLTGEVDFSITAGVPGSINTYASNDGGATNVLDDTYDQRFILEVYDGDALAYREEKTVEIGNTASFDVRLLAKKYKMALWADFVENERTDDNLYSTENGLDEVTVKSGRSAGQEIADAYCHSEEIDLTEGSLSKPITLTRPFGKIRLVSTDNPSNAGATAPASVQVTYGSTIEVPSGYNVLTGEASSTKISAGTYSFVPYKEAVSVGGVSKGELYILGIDYIFASRSVTNVSFDVKVDGNGTRRVGNIPVSTNKLTTVIGNFYTNEGSIDVIVEDDFGNGENVEYVPVETTASTLAEAESALEKLAADPTTHDKDIVITIPNTPASGDNSDAIEMPELSNNVTIVFESGISAAGLTINDVLASGSQGNDFTGNLTIKNNSTEQQGNLIINLPKGSCTLDGGSYSSITVTTADNTFVVGEDVSIETLNVNKGNVIIYGTVAPDKITIDDGASSKIYWGAGTEDRLREVLAYPAEKNHGVILTADILGTSDYGNDGACIRVNNDGYLFDGNGYAISGNAGQNVMVIGSDNIEVKNLEIFQPAEGSASNGITVYVAKGVKISDVTIHNCRKAGLIVNGAEVTATGLHTYGNAWGAVNVSKGSGVTDEPIFDFSDGTSSFEEENKVWVDCGTPWTVNAPAGWGSFITGNVTVFGQGFPYTGAGTESDPKLITSKEDLEKFAVLVNNGNEFSNIYIKLTTDIDLNNEIWTPIGKSGKTFKGHFDGGNHIISNLEAGNSLKSDVGLFGFTQLGSIKNIHIHNAQIKGYQNVGVVAGTPYTTKYSNIKVTGLIKVDGYAYVGGMFGKNVYANLTDLTIDADEGSYVKAYSVEGSTAYNTYVGGVIGFIGEGTHKLSNVVSNINVIGSTAGVGGISGNIHYGNTFESCYCSGNVTLEKATYDGDQYWIGGIAGTWVDTQGTVTFTDCHFNGNLSSHFYDQDISAEIQETNKIVGERWSYGSPTSTGQLIIDGVVVSGGSAQ